MKCVKEGHTFNLGLHLQLHPIFIEWVGQGAWEYTVWVSVQSKHNKSHVTHALLCIIPHFTFTGCIWKIEGATTV